jgi:Flp pilus assembly protein TadG
LLNFRKRRSERGQSVVEFALILPLLVVIMVAIVDLGRIYTTMLSVESAAREGADYASFGSQKWATDDSAASTITELTRRSCVAASNLPDYVGGTDTCTNPLVNYCLSNDDGASCVPYSSGLDCGNETREPPCKVTVTLQYDFHLLVPLNFDILGASYGLPDTLTFQRFSTYSVTDLSMDPFPTP